MTRASSVLPRRTRDIKTGIVTKSDGINIDVGRAKAQAGQRTLSAFKAPTQRAPENKVRRADPVKASAPKTITSSAPKASSSSWKSASKNAGGNLSAHVKARDAAKASGNKEAYAKAQNAINSAYGISKRHKTPLGVQYKARLETKRSSGVAQDMLSRKHKSLNIRS